MMKGYPRKELRSQATLFVVVLNWNGLDDLAECLQSVSKSTYQSQTILVDNGSSDDSIPFVSERFPQVTIIATGENRGFGANNFGIREALGRGADYVLLLNNDTSVDPQCFEILMRFAESTPEAGILSPRICYYSDPDTIWYDGGILRRERGFLKSYHVNEDSKVASVSNEAREVDYICGCAMLIRRTVVESIGELDARFFMYWEDGEFSLRAKRAGFRLFHVPLAVVLHKVSSSIGGKSSPDVRYYTTRNGYFLSGKGLSLGSAFKLLTQQLRNCLWTYFELMEDNEKEQALAMAEVGWDSLIRRHGKRRGHAPKLIVRWFERQRRYRRQGRAAEH